jgi:protein TonB
MRRFGTGRPQGSAAGFCWTLLVHGGALAFLLEVARPPAPSPPVYAIDLVAAPLPAPKQRLAPEAQPVASPEPPAPVKPAPKPDTKTAPVKQPKPEPKPQPSKRPPSEGKPSTEPAPKTSAPETPAPGETPSTGRDAATVKTPGLEFPFPEYLRNIANQIYRRWARPTGNVRLRAEIFFLVHRDGTVSDIRFVNRSGNFSYDLEAQGAIEAAGSARAFGPLPDGWTNDVLPISFFFEPRPE